MQCLQRACQEAESGDVGRKAPEKQRPLGTSNGKAAYETVRKLLGTGKDENLKSASA